MFIKMLVVIYHVVKVLLLPFEALWAALFAIPVGERPPEKILLLDIIGGSGKSTLARLISIKFGHYYIENDDCKFGENWKRWPDDKYEENLNSRLAKSTMWVVASTYHDPKLPRQRECMDKLIKDANLVVWQDYPMTIILWRKLFRSYKRAIGVVEQGTAPEKWSNVKAMVKKIYHEFNDRRLVMSANQSNVRQVNWPWYYKVN